MTYQAQGPYVVYIHDVEMTEEPFLLVHPIAGTTKTAHEQAALLADMLNKWDTLLDPVAVHANMLRGTIAKPTPDQIRHLYPEMFQDVESLDGYPIVAENTRLRAAIDALQRVFEQAEADSKRAVERWRAKHPDRADEWPDKTDLLVFVMELLDEAELLLGMQRAALDAVIHAYGSQDDSSGGMDKAIAQAKLVVAPRPAPPTVDDVPSCGSENDYRRAVSKPVDTSDIPEAGEDFFMSAKLRTPSDPM